MRLHHLTMTAFGPYADSQTVDFDRLGEAGMFLLTGPTGAGKTTILDAVCFALYGVVPGERGVRDLRSHHAAPGVRPEVELELTLGGRRLRVWRSPEWQRPKRRGAGTTKEHAAARLTDLSDGSARLLSARIAEVGHELSLALGMRSEQFLQVVLLPQGGFASFLHAGSDDRQAVLQRLFRTQRFAQVEDWLRDHCRAVAERAADAEQVVRQLLAAVAHRAGSDLPSAPPTPQPVAAALAGGRLTLHDAGALPDAATSWCAAVVGAAIAAEQAAIGEDAAADRRLRQLDARAQHLQQWADHAERVAAASAELAALDAEDAAAAQERAALAAHERAVGLQPALEEADQADAAVRAAEEAVSGVVQRLAPLMLRVSPHEPPEALAQGPLQAAGLPVSLAGSGSGSDTEDASGDGACGAVERAVAERLGRLRQLQARTGAGREAELRAGRLAAVVADFEAAAHRREESLRSLPHKLADARAAWAAAEAAADDQPRAAAALTLAEQRRSAARALVPARVAQQELEDRCRDTRDAAAAARAHHLDLVERRLAGIAAELAGGLREGQGCPVCGSAAHPQPARPGSAPVAAADQEAALAEVERCEALLATLRSESDESAARVQQLRLLADGLTVPEAQDAVSRCQADVAAAGSARDRSPDLAAACAELEAQITQAQEEDEATRQALVSATADLAAARREAADVVNEVTAVLARTGEGPGAKPREEPGAETAGTGLLAALTSQLEAAVAEAEDLGRELVRLRAAVATRARARVRAESTATTAAAAAVRAGFTGAVESRGALLAADRATVLREHLAQRDARRAAALAARAAPAPATPVEVTGAAADPDLATAAPHLRRSARAAQLQAAGAVTPAREAAGRRGSVTRCREALTGLADDVTAALSTWVPVRDEHATADGLSRLVRGMSAYNQLQMRLSSYVLATRLDQVLAAANARLRGDGAGRYSLHRCGGQAGAGRTGLDVEVLDAWTGEARSPRTLSGGETFVISLALALGLADVVTQESGGSRAETLFVDEGFGALDADTLDDVLDRLDELRAGGRTVGVVSHVAELRNRIPVQLEVSSDRCGSTVRIRTLVP